MKTAVFYGGIAKEQNIAVLRGDDKPHIVIGTPGRIMDLVERYFIILFFQKLCVFVVFFFIKFFLNFLLCILFLNLFYFLALEF